MAYVTISIVHPQAGKHQQVEALLQELVAYYQRQPGYIRGHVLQHTDGSGVYGRIGLWQSDADAERAAESEPALALHTRLNALVVAVSHDEYAVLHPVELLDVGAP